LGCPAQLKVLLQISIVVQVQEAFRAHIYIYTHKYTTHNENKVANMALLFTTIVIYIRFLPFGIESHGLIIGSDC